VPSKDRRKLLESFRDDAACRVLLSTDAGGTGLNLQVADTVINLEAPWNPAALDQRIARVHRMGQSKPVRVILLVTRGSIEERVLKTMEVKRSLFAGIFDGATDEVSFEALGQQKFLQTVRELIGELPEVQAPQPEASKGAQQKLITAGVQFLEALAEIINGDGGQLPPELARRATIAVRQLSTKLDIPPDSPGK
jgi:superfamily II DNA/RNA helicase